MVEEGKEEDKWKEVGNRILNETCWSRRKPLCHFQCVS